MVTDKRVVLNERASTVGTVISLLANLVFWGSVVVVGWCFVEAI